MTNRARYTRTPAVWLAGCSDVGHRHETNQDAFSMAVRDGERHVAMIAVADGVSSAAGAERASLVAADRAVETLVTLHQEGVSGEAALDHAFVAAQQGVLEASGDEEPSACTLIAAQVDGASMIVGNVGDTRAYWLGDDGGCMALTTDDSMAQAHIAMGMSRDDAESGQHAHAITKWLGRRATDVSPTATRHAAEIGGWLLLCTDGLWNYASAPAAMRTLFDAHLAVSQDPTILAEALVDWANERGGKDNITVALVRIDV